MEDLTHKGKKIWGEGTPWKNKSAFYTYLRGCIRRAWSRHPAKINKINNARFKIDKKVTLKSGEIKIRQVWACKCEICNVIKPMQNSDKNKRTKTNHEVDHIIPAGSFNDLEDLVGFFERLLFVTEDDLRILCKDCHRIITYAEKEGLSFEEAAITKEAIGILASKKDKEWLIERGIAPASTQKARREQIIKLLRG